MPDALTFTRRQRVPTSFLFGPGANTYSTYTVNADGSFSFAKPEWIPLSDSYVNGFAVSPAIDGSANVAFNRPLILRVTTRYDISQKSNDTFFIVPTSGIAPILPVYSLAFEIALYAVAEDKDFATGVVVF